MTASTVKIIITAEIEDRKVELESMELKIDEKLDERIYQGCNQQEGRCMANSCKLSMTAFEK